MVDVVHGHAAVGCTLISGRVMQCNVSMVTFIGMDTIAMIEHGVHALLRHSSTSTIPLQSGVIGRTRALSLPMKSDR